MQEMQLKVTLFILGVHPCKYDTGSTLVSDKPASFVIFWQSPTMNKILICVLSDASSLYTRLNKIHLKPILDGPLIGIPVWFVWQMPDDVYSGTKDMST